MDSKIKYSCAKGCTTYPSKTAFLKGGRSPAEYFPGGNCYQCYGLFSENFPNSPSSTSPETPTKTQMVALTPMNNKFTILGTLPKSESSSLQTFQNKPIQKSHFL